MLAGFIMRRFICGESSRGYGPVFARAIHSKKRGEEAEAVQEPISALEQYLL